MKIRKRFPKPFSYYLGSCMMVGAALFLVFIYYPLIAVYFFSPEVVVGEEISQSPQILIPTIGVVSPIVLNVDPWNESDYHEALQHGVAHAQDTSLPGEQGTSFLFAHSSDAPWRITQYNTAFFRLGELEQGDAIYIERDGKRYEYAVYDRREVWPDEVEYLQQDQGNTLILQTCTPVGTSLRRLLVFAHPIAY